MTQVTFYPGCSLDSTAIEYRNSLEEAFRLLDFDLIELEDWNCCGATSAHSLDEELALLLPARNLALASKTTNRMVVPCAACYNRQKNAAVRLEENTALKKQVELDIDRPFEQSVSVVNILDFLLEHLDAIGERVKMPLSGLKVVCYYGCLLTRPPGVTGEKHYEDPMAMDTIVEALGATPIQWSYKTECCGASHSIARGDLVRRLVSRIMSMAFEAGANAVITACPLCQMNLDTRQDSAQMPSGDKANMPAVYITELMSAAFGSKKTAKFFKGHFVHPAGIVP